MSNRTDLRNLASLRYYVRGSKAELDKTSHAYGTFKLLHDFEEALEAHIYMLDDEVGVGEVNYIDQVIVVENKKSKKDGKKST